MLQDNSRGYTASINPDYKTLEDDSCIIGPDGKKRYVFLYEMAKETQDLIQLRNELLNVLLAGRDTTASLLSNTFFVLARRPEIWAKLKAEVNVLDGVPPNYDTLRGMKYVKYLLNECESHDPRCLFRVPQNLTLPFPISKSATVSHSLQLRARTRNRRPQA